MNQKISPEMLAEMNRQLSATCNFCGVPGKNPAVAHKAHCRIYRRWAGALPTVDRGATLTGQERLTPEALANRISWDQ